MARDQARDTAIIVLAAALFGLAPAAAVAQTTGELEQARAAWKAGSALFEKGRFGAAKVQFEKGLRLSHKGGFLYNMAECARMIGDRSGAHGLYARYLREYPQGKHKDEVRKRCRALKTGPCLSAPARAAKAKARPATAKAGPDLTPPRPRRSKSFLPTSDSDPTLAQKSATSTPWYKHWGFWTAVGAVVVAGTVTTIAVVSSSGDPVVPDGDSVLDYR